MKLIRVLSALGVFICFVLWVSSALASRNSSGTMAGINGPYVAGTVISSSVINARLADIETELTDSASRSGKGGFTAPVRGADGTVTAPTFAFTSETGTGIYRIGSSDAGFSINQTKTGEWTANGYRSANGAVATPSLSFFNDTGSGLYRSGSNDIRFAVNGADVTKWTAGVFSVSPTSSGATAAGNTVGLIESSGTPIFSMLAPNAQNEAICMGDVANSCRGLIQYFNSTNGSADQMRISTGGTERARLTNSGFFVGGSQEFSVGTTGIVTAPEYLCSSYGASATRCGAVAANGSGDATVTIAASMHACICSDATVTTPAATGCNLSGTTLTVKTTALHAINYFCF